MSLKKTVEFYQKCLTDKYAENDVFSQGGKIALYGAGTVGYQWSLLLKERNKKILFFIDDYKKGTLEGIPVISFPEFLHRCYEVDMVYITAGDLIKAWHIRKKLEQQIKLPLRIQILNHFLAYDEKIKCKYIFKWLATQFNTNYTSLLDIYRIFDDSSSRNLFALLIALAKFLENTPAGVKVDLLKLHQVFLEILDRIQHFKDKSCLYLHPDCAINLTEGEVVIECGAVMGNDTKYFAKLIGTKGKVFACEESTFFPILKQNIGRIANVKLQEVTFESFSIDDFIAHQKIPFISFIKIDTEGYEKRIIEQSQSTLRSFHPKLAMALYYKPEYLCEIPLLIKKIVPAYKLFLVQNEPDFFEGIKLFGTV